MKLSTYTLSLLYLLVCSGPAQAEVSMRISPERTQFFLYESMSLSCEEEGNPAPGWSVTRKTIEGVHGSCNKEWGSTEGGSCLVEVYRRDSGVYWCQSEIGEQSRALDITISEGSVILESPVLPVKEGSDVTLRCLYRTKTTMKPSSNLPADFYRDGAIISRESTGQMTIRGVSKSDEGFYKCRINDFGESPPRVESM